MKITSLHFLCFMGSAFAVLPRIEMDVLDSPMVATSRAPDIATCCRRKPINAMRQFVRGVRRQRLQGPCDFLMKQTLSGNVTDYLSKTAQALDDHKVAFTNFLVDIPAPKELWSYIDRIYFVQKTPGANCISFKLSQRTKEKPRYFKGIRSAADNDPLWEIGRHKQIKGGDYLLEVPTGCLVDAQELVIEMAHVYELPGMQPKLINGSGELVVESDACSIPLTRTAIDSYEAYLQIAETQPRECEYSYRREYEWSVPATHISVKDGKTTVSAQLALHESMLGDERRHITRLSVGSLSGPGCSKTALYAHGTRDGGESSARIKKLTYKDNGVSIKVSWDFSDVMYSLRFVLPSDCKIENPIVEFLVIDQKDVDSDETVKGVVDDDDRKVEYIKGVVKEEVDFVKNGLDDDKDVVATESVTTTQFSTTSMLDWFIDSLIEHEGNGRYYGAPEDDGHAYYWENGKVHSKEYF